MVSNLAKSTLVLIYNIIVSNKLTTS